MNTHARFSAVWSWSALLLGLALLLALTPLDALAGSDGMLLGGRGTVALVRNDYTSASATTSAYRTVVASTIAPIRQLDLTDTSGSLLILATGPTCSALTPRFYIPRNATGFIVLEAALPTASCIAVKAVDVNATTGDLVITQFY